MSKPKHKTRPKPGFGLCHRAWRRSRTGRCAPAHSGHGAAQLYGAHRDGEERLAPVTSAACNERFHSSPGANVFEFVRAFG
jgi:hypothetical protein